MNASGERIYLDTVFVQGLLNRRDKYHSAAQRLLPIVRAAAEVYVSDAVLVEIANGLSSYNRSGAAEFIRQCYATANMHVIPVDSELLLRGLDLYEARPDKDWGLTDCVSFVIMSDRGLVDAITADVHYQQAGYRALMLESE